MHKLLTGGVNNQDPNASIGGVPSTTQVVNNTENNLFDKVSSQESSDGLTDYRCEVSRNTNPTLPLNNAKIYIESNTTSVDTSVEIGLDGNGINTNPVTIQNDKTAPASVTFSAPATEAAALAVGNIPSGEFFAYWTKRIVDQNADAAGDEYIVAVIGDTDA